MGLLPRSLALKAEGLASLLPGKGRRLSVLIFHRVVPEPDPMNPDEIDADRFDRLLTMLGREFHVLPMAEALSRRAAGTLPARSVAITFDDGYADNFTVACPILRRHGMEATFFVASGFLDGGLMWNDAVIETLRQYGGATLDLAWLDMEMCATQSVVQRQVLAEALLLKLKYLDLDGRKAALARLVAQTGSRLPEDLMMSSAQLRGLRDAGMEIGGHTVSHPILAVLDEDEARSQMARDRARLAELLGRPPRFFAYPNGRPGKDYTAVHARLARELGYEAAFTTSHGSVGSESGLYELPRFTPWDHNLRKFSLRLLRNYLNVDAPQLASARA